MMQFIKDLDPPNNVLMDTSAIINKRYAEYGVIPILVRRNISIKLDFIVKMEMHTK